ncbi:MAG: EAL domain-containing protein [Betaproteobacteria bacterium]|nr:EAL domain-containing protein [Betaproteobacteria bacterium]
MVVITAAFTWLSLRTLDERQQAALAQQQVRSVDLLGRLFQHQSSRLQALGTLVADLPGVRAALRQADKPGLARVFEPFWSDLNLTHGLDRVAFLLPGGEVLGDWGMADAGAHIPRLAGEAMHDEEPSHRLECKPRCLYITAVPLVERGTYVGTVILSAGLQELVLDFRRLSGHELAVLDTRGANSPVGNLISVSGGASYEDLVRSLRPEDRAEGHQAGGDVFQVEWADRHFRLYRLSAPPQGGDAVKFLAIVDITAEKRDLARAVRSSLILGGFILVLALGLLYFLLRPTMNRLRQAMLALPLLGEGRYDQARAALPVKHRAAMHRDEVDDLAGLTHALADTLEELHALSREYTTSLKAQALQLEQERDFVAGLLDTAPVLILTYGRDQRIRLANVHAVSSSGHETVELKGHVFPDLFMTGQQREHFAGLLDRMEMGDVAHSESSFFRPDGVERDVVWFHSCLDDQHGERAYLSVGLDVTDYRQVERSLMVLAEHDSITGLYNRRAFKRELDGLLANGVKGVLILCDIDEFRAVNDSVGHEDGDRVLQGFARHVESLQPRPVLSARLGGDDFAMVFAGISSAEAIVIARGLNQPVAYPGGEGEGGIRSRLSACVGIVLFNETSGDADNLLANGEIALTQARAKGHGSWHLYSSDDAYRELAGRRAHWRTEVEQALDEERFVMFFQPIQHIASGRIGHYEALLRLKGRDGTLVSPGLFIDVAESTGLIRRIDRWVIKAVVDFVAERGGDVKVALNLSSRSFDDDMAYETMKEALARHGVDGGRLLLEITETAALANFSSATRIMAQLRGLGCAFGLDDFGVGYSSFQYLKELPVDFVKIDGSFIKGLLHNQDDVVFVKALNDAVRGFGKYTIAEFVEDEATLAILREIGVDYAQGYLIGRPAPELLA